ncbi:hypothetical protein GJU40_08670 [Bacillus lacus]|uniref:DUF5392 family protein n=1 Tax=Metabacillus lacus TaxID=1983721 RepID=A0A7X2IZX9_9BACI|nr:DUF5392 family protein [Metabacillus lacus]MRX72223.1 hypothetical protein [Metabacillus lacus]
MDLSRKNTPSFVQKEIEHMEELVSPVSKKASKYVFWSFLLMPLSFFNLFVILFINPSSSRSIPLMAVFYAVLGAAGLALYREARFHHKEILKKAHGYILERINNSRVASESQKKEFTFLIQKQPIRALDFFIQFLEQENKKHKRDNDILNS